MENKQVYVVVHRTWSSSKICAIFLKENDAQNYASHLEFTKTTSDRYMEYYVESYNLR